jgi:uncharacterized membrane protein YidH (DUF202 family)
VTGSPGQGQDQGHGHHRDRSQGDGQGQPGDDPEESDTGLARERTSLAWTRTAISFGAVGGAVLKANVVTGLVILALAPVIWQLGRPPRGGAAGTGTAGVTATRLFLITVAIIAVALICLAVAIFGQSAPGALR